MSRQAARDGKEVSKMTMAENARLIIGLRAKGWTDTEINDLVLWVETGDVQYKPKQQETSKD